MTDEEKKELKIKEYLRVQGERRDFGVTTSAIPPPIPQPERIKKEIKKK
jgi:hypothetical protein